MRLLGERILAEVDDPHTSDTSARWLAHHLAGLMMEADAAEAEGAADAGTKAAAARGAILDLWQHRSSWPRGWPPPRAAAAVSVLDSLLDPHDPVWPGGNAVARLHQLHHQMLAILVDLASGDSSTVEQGWLNTFGEHLTPSEVAVLTRVAEAPARAVTSSVDWEAAVSLLEEMLAAGPEDWEAQPTIATANGAEPLSEHDPHSPRTVLSSLARLYQQTLDSLITRSHQRRDG